MPQSNINIMYDAIVCDLADRAKLIMDEQPEIDKTEAIWQAEDEGLIYTADQAYIVAHAFSHGLFIEETDAEGRPIRRGGDWGRQLDWDAIGEKLYEDIADELDRQLGE